MTIPTWWLPAGPGSWAATPARRWRRRLPAGRPTTTCRTACATPALGSAEAAARSRTRRVGGRDRPPQARGAALCRLHRGGRLVREPERFYRNNVAGTLALLRAMRTGI